MVSNLPRAPSVTWATNGGPSAVLSMFNITPLITGLFLFINVFLNFVTFLYAYTSTKTVQEQFGIKSRISYDCINDISLIKGSCTIL